MLSLVARTFASNRSQRGLWHGVDIRFGNQYCFSHKAWWKPNVHFKTFWSDALNRSLRLSVSMKALRCIRKKGSLDNYLLSTDNRDMRSRMGELLKTHVTQKLLDPEYQVPYIPHVFGRVVTQRERKKLKYALCRQLPPYWAPPELRHTNWKTELVNEQEERFLANNVYIPPVQQTVQEQLESGKSTGKMNLSELEKMSPEEGKAWKKAQMARLMAKSEEVMQELPMKSQTKYKPTKAELKEQQGSGDQFDVYFDESARKKKKVQK